MTTKSLTLLVDQARSVLEDIRQHPEFKTLDYSPDVTVGDAIASLAELEHRLYAKPTFLRREEALLFEGFSE